jgi:hypothetical protein
MKAQYQRPSCSILTMLAVVLLFISPVYCQQPVDTLIPTRGFCISAPKPASLDKFITFINDELAPRLVNTLILRVDYNYQYKSHPELRDSVALSYDEVKQIVAVCKKNNIKLIPQINLLGHQSWANNPNTLLKVYPQFDETPDVIMPQNYVWPNSDSLYCKSYCPLHPEVHKVVFELVNEICDVFESTDFHAGLDEVFYIGSDKCPRCSGKDKATLFAGEVKLIRDHLAQSNRKLWIWGDRLIDGKTSGLGIWEASNSNTFKAIDLIPKDVIICDWHYERPEQTPVYFALKGFNVMSCPWRKPQVAIGQIDDLLKFRAHSNWIMKNRYQGVLQTVWSDAGTFLDGFYNDKPDEQGGNNTPWNCFKVVFDKIDKLNTIN